MARAPPSLTRPIRKICCIGAGYVGGPTCAVIACQVPEVQCVVVDSDAVRIEAWNSNTLPIYEPRLDEYVRKSRDGIPGVHPRNLVFTTDIERAVQEADTIFISVNTPAKTTGLGAGRAPDLTWLESATKAVAANVRPGFKLIVEKSTVPCKTAAIIANILQESSCPGFEFEVLSNPEFLAQGTAITDLVEPDRILIGSLGSDDARPSGAGALVDLYAKWVPRERIITMDLWSSELAKLAANAMLAQRISSINSLSAICEAVDAKIDEVAFAVGLDKRVGSSMLKSSVGFGGSCFRKDILSLVYLAESLHLPEVANYWRSVVDINEWQKNRFVSRIVSALHGTLQQKKLAILGFAYKKNTGDTRESPAISVVQSLLAENARVSIYDPQVKQSQILQSLTSQHPSGLLENLSVCDDVYAACQGAHAIVVMTEWDEFKVDDAMLSSNGTKTPIYDRPAPDIETKPLNEHQMRVDWVRIAELVERPMLVFDGRNILDRARLTKLGFKLISIGIMS